MLNEADLRSVSVCETKVLLSVSAPVRFFRAVITGMCPLYEEAQCVF